MYLLSTAFWIFFLASLPVLFVPFAVVALITGPFDKKRRITHLVTCLWGAMYIAVNPVWKVKVSGRKKIPHKGCVIVANHASLIDVLVLFCLFRQFRWVSKASNFKLPFIGWVMRIDGYVPLVRGERKSVVEMMQKCERFIEQGIPVLFFPEGTRSKDGNLKEFKNGAFDLAMKMRCPVYPVAVSGTATALPKHSLSLRNKMDARVTVLEPLEPQLFASVDGLRDAARTAIHEELVRARGLEPPQA